MISNTKHILENAMKTMAVFLVGAGFLTIPCIAQDDSVKTFKNTIRVNITNPLIFSPKYTIIGYERVVRDHQTFSVGVGRFAFPKFREETLDSLNITDRFHDKGFNFSFDYRFYLKKENKFNAPRGVYLGPYYAFNYWNRELTWDLNTSGFTGEAKTSMVLTANLIGLQLGYQFILWDRLAIDMILMGPGAWFFKLKTDFDTSLPPEEQEMLLEKINDAIQENFPGSDLVIHGGGFEAKKTTTTNAMGFRYMINIGFRF